VQPPSSEDPRSRPPYDCSSAPPRRPPLLAVATRLYAGEGFDCPALDTLFLAVPVAVKARLVQYAGPILRPYPGKSTAEEHDYHDVATGVLASSLAERARAGVRRPAPGSGDGRRRACFAGPVRRRRP
jgi:superfamily II DNA or RNA helicase